MQSELRKVTRSIALSPQHWDMIDRLADTNGLTASSLIRVILLGWLNTHAAESPQMVIDHLAGVNN